MPNYAEQQSEAIYFSLMKVNGNANVFGGGLEGAAEGVKSLPGNQCGVYSIWAATTPNLNSFIPIYLGYTGRNFRTRLSEHCASGAIYEAYTNPRIKPAGGIGVVFNTIDWDTGRSVEAALLQLFDFAYNTADNSPVRDPVPDGSSEADLQSAPKFPTTAGEIETFNEIVAAIESLNKATGELAHHFHHLKK
ncbi:hypothetical protein [Peteryoungia ipomoeae]|uniref:GIY-YIG homing endonuclease n=1 Tax=Peteryoungia ipomoeae TaxID=1210932 RepID=A0A4S8P5R6_9HYPH|nr:hypothetical protein [Peteryoungia ipomoeae]THV25518.1 hypothetical protein FAA97_04835 [Peteryoungia ipomoeae]